MVAGGRIQFLKPIRIGEKARRTGRVTDLVAKRGRSGQLVFASVRQAIEGEDGLALVEEQDIVYREHPRTPTARLTSEPPAALEAEQQRIVLPDEAMLFRYSALLFNAHRLHYDRRYVTEVESYPGLIVHGQLIATCLPDLTFRPWQKSPAIFSLRHPQPAFAGAPFPACGRG